MMMKKDDKPAEMMTSSTASAEAANKATCIAPESLDSALLQVKDATSAQEEARQAEADAQEALRAAKTEIAALQLDMQAHNEQLAKSSDTADRMLRVQEDLAKQMAVAQERSEEKLADLKEIVAAKDKELASVQQTINQSLKDEQSVCSQKVAETQDYWKKELNNLETTAELRVQKAKEAALEEAKKDLGRQSLSQMESSLVREIEQEKSGIMGEMKALQQLYDRLDGKYDAKMQEEEKEKLAYFSKNLDKEVDKIVSEMQVAWKAEMKSLKTRSEEALAKANQEAQDSLTKLQTEMEEKTQKQVASIKKASDSQVAAIKRTEQTLRADALTMHDSHMHQLVQIMDDSDAVVADLKAAHAEEIEKAKEATLQALAELLEKMESKAARVAKEYSEHVGALEQTNEEYDHEKMKLNKMIEDLRDELYESHEVRFSSILTALRVDYANSLSRFEQETAYWAQAFVARAYFNVTQLREDFHSFAHTTKATTLDKINEGVEMGKEQAQKAHQLTYDYGSKKLTSFVDFTAPCTRPVVEFYDKHLSSHVEKIVSELRPHYQKAEDFVLRMISQARAKLLDWFDQLVALARQRCTSSRLQIEQAPSMVRKRFESVCKEPEVVIKDALRMMAIILIILLRRTIWGILWGLIRLTVAVPWYFLTFRFLRKSAAPANGEAMPASTDYENVEFDGQ
jgi:DNA repair exonuclease SbcCD ATPase subunit